MAETYTADVKANDLTYIACRKDPLKNCKSSSLHILVKYSILNELGH